MAILATGDSIHSVRWVEYFARQGHEIHWFSLAEFRHPTDPRVRRYRLSRGRVEAAQVAEGFVRLRRLLRAIRPDVLQVHSAGWNGVIAAMSGFHPCVVTAWGSEVLISARSPLKRPFVRLALQHADVITCDAQHMRLAIGALGVPEQKVRIIHFGTDTERFRPMLADPAVRHELRIDDDETVVISLRSLEPLYDVESLIHAVPLVLRGHPRTVFVILGEGSERTRLMRLAEALGVGPRVRFMGEVRNDRLPAYFSVADVYVSTAMSDAGLAASTAEAMACGLPVVVTNSGENALWVQDGHGGYLVPVRAPNPLAEKIAYLLHHPNVRSRFGDVNRATIAQHNNYAIEMSKMEEVYRSLVQSPRAAEAGVGPGSAAV